MCHHSRSHSNRIHGQVLVFWLPFRRNEDISEEQRGREGEREREKLDREPKRWSDGGEERVSEAENRANEC